jgi:hypothetical protein
VADGTAKIIIYRALIESELDVTKHPARRARDCHFEPRFAEFRPRIVRSLSKASRGLSRSWIRSRSQGAGVAQQFRGGPPQDKLLVSRPI